MTSRVLPEPGGDRVVACRPQAFTETIARSRVRPRGRDAADPHRHPRVGVGGELRMVATDSYRLSVKETKLEPPLAEGFEANVPARALEELARIARPATTSRSIGVRTNQVVF